MGIVLLSSLALVACGDDSSTSNQPDGPLVPVAESVAGEPGTPLPNGFEVETGTVLVGSAVPEGDGWWAELYVTGDPKDVVAGYLAQAKDLGLQPAELPSGAPEFGVEGVPAEAQQYTVCGTATEGANGYQCRTAAFTGSSRAPCLRIDLARGSRGDDPENSLLLRYATDDAECVSTGLAIIGDPTSKAPEMPTSRPPAPGVGEPLRGSLLSVFEVAEGSEVAAPNFTGECGEAVILGVDGDPDDVFEAYADQAAAIPNSEGGEPVTRKVDDNTTVRVVRRLVPGGGGSYTVTLVDSSQTPDMIVISACEG